MSQFSFWQMLKDTTSRTTIIFKCKICSQPTDSNKKRGIINKCYVDIRIQVYKVMIRKKLQCIIFDTFLPYFIVCVIMMYFSQGKYLIIYSVKMQILKKWGLRQYRYIRFDIKVNKMSTFHWVIWSVFIWNKQPTAITNK